MNTPRRAAALTRTQAACLLAAPIVLIAARAVTTPFRDKGDTAGYLAAIANNHATSNVGAVLGIIGALLLIPALIGLGRIAGERMPRLAWLGAGLATIGAVALTIVAMLAIIGGQVAQFASPADRVDVWNKILNSGAGAAVGQLMLVSGVIGMVLLAVGLFRSGPVHPAAAVLLGIGGATTMLTAPGPVRVVLIAAAALTLAAFTWVFASTRAASAPQAPVHAEAHR